MEIRIGICQLDVTDVKEQNVQKALEMIKKAAEKGAELVVLPEMFNCPYQLNYFKPFAEEIPEGFTYQSLSQAAQENKVYLIGGSIPEKDGNHYYNTSLFFDKNGELIGLHRKIHLFDIDVKGKIAFKESAVLSPGKKITVIETPLAKIGIAICYDIRFPELIRVMALEGAEIICVPAAFNMTTGPLHWETLFRCRAIDNQLFMIAASPARKVTASYVAYGHSLAVDPWGKVINEAGTAEELLIVNLDLTEIQKVRQAIPSWQHRRTDLYQLNYNIALKEEQ